MSKSLEAIQHESQKDDNPCQPKLQYEAAEHPLYIINPV